MYRSRPFRRGRRPDARRAFTLVELITAASLMTVMMLGVVQIFAVITRTAAEAEGLHFAQQQTRALFDRLHTDLAGMTREGYLKIHTTTHTPPGGGGATYDINTLAFVTVGPCVTQWHSGSTDAYEANAAEVVYTSNVRTPNTVLKVPFGSGTKQVDPRRGILARGQWMLAGEENGTADDKDDRPATEVAWLSNMFINQNPPKGTSVAAKDRISKGGTTLGDSLTVWPWTTLYGKSDFPQSLKRVMASCVSDFYVEAFNPKAATDATLFASPADPSILTKDFVWSTNFAATKLKSWPRAIRVTVAVHDPGDTSAPVANQPLRGYVMQEIFWLSDP